MDQAILYTSVALWAIGALIAIVGMLLLLQRMAWALCKDVVGWPVIVRALRMYREAERSKQAG